MCYSSFKVFVVATGFICLLWVGTEAGTSATNKLSLASWGSYLSRESKGPGTYSFGYDLEDPVTGNVQFRQEERHPGGGVTGSYGYVDANGQPQVVHYVADSLGYRVVTFTPTIGQLQPQQQKKQQQEQQTWPKVVTDTAAAWIRNPEPVLYQMWR